jgi:hypothetical protein
MDPCITILENRPRADRGIAGQSETCPSNKRRVISGIDAIDRAYYTIADGDGQTKAARVYTRLNQVLDEHDFDKYVEELCQRFYSEEGRPGLPPGRYFRLLLIGYFEGLDAERALAWRAADSFALREFLRLGIAGGFPGPFDDLPNAAPDRSGDARSGLQLGCCNDWPMRAWSRGTPSAVMRIPRRRNGEITPSQNLS